MEVLIHIGFCLALLLAMLQGVEGEDYLVVVAYEGEDSHIRYSAGETGGLVEIQYPYLAYRSVYPLGPFHGASHTVRDKMKIASGVENAAIVVSGSDEDINIVVDADGVFSPLPISALGTKYILPSSLAPDSDYQSLLLIATHNMSTTVDIFFRMNSGNISFANYHYTGGDVLSVKLNPYQTLRISTPYDLNGTVINSEHSVAVYSGMEYTSNYTVYDQLLPVKHYGREYVVAVDDTKLELQIISEHSHVQITFSSGTTFSTEERSFYNRSLERGENLHFTTTSPVLVTLSRADGYSSSFTTVPPVHSYVTHTGVCLFSEDLNTTLKILTDRRATVLIEDNEVNGLLTWSNIADSRYKVGTLVQSQSRRIYSTSISSDLPFTVLSFYNGSVYNSGYNLSAGESEHYTGPSYLVVFIADSSSNTYLSVIFASAGETGGQWRVQDPQSGRVWSRRFNPYNTDYFIPNRTTTSVVLVHVRDDTIHVRGAVDSFTSFSPLPVSALGTKYIMSSCLPTNDNVYQDTKSYISVLVIATHNKKADIDVIFRLDGNVAYDGKTYVNGDTLRVSLDRYQTVSLNSTSDMTRTIITATETIAVYSGTYHVNQSLFTTFEQLLPVKHYGHEYIVAIQDPFYKDGTYQLQVVTDHSDTNIMFNNGSSISVGEDGVYHGQCGNTETFYFSTTRPVMVTLCAIRRNYYSDGLVVVPPISLYSKLTALQAHGTMQILTDQENNNVEVNQIRDTISTVFSPPVRWKNVPGTRFKVGTSSGYPYTTTIRSKSTFAVLGYYVYSMYTGGYTFRTADNPTNVAMIVGVVCAIVIVALLVALVTYMFCIRRKKLPVKEDPKPGDDLPPPSYFTVPDADAQGGQSEAVYTELK
ncbi:uncharacterized protein [Haliotis asinina]|uniref:uncharacterized protein n=1 Tax=Haliotis asinina TaxID=109174 RepID=UPI00353232AF